MTKREMEVNFSGPLVIGIIVLLIVAFIGLNGFAFVGPGERGVLTTFGKVEPYSLGEGIHFKVPIVQNVSIIDVKTQKVSTDASAASKDLQVVKTTVALNYKVNADQSHILFQNIGYDYRSRVIDPAIEESVKAATAQFTAEELITKRALVKQEIEEVMKGRLTGYYITVQNLSITNFDFSPEFNDAIEAKVKAEQEALKAERELDRIKVEKQQKITQAEADNEKVKLEADAEAYSIRQKADSEAYALQVVREQLEQSKQLISYEAIRKWNGTVPNYMLGGGAVPFISLNDTSSIGE